MWTESNAFQISKTHEMLKLRKRIYFIIIIIFKSMAVKRWHRGNKRQRSWRHLELSSNIILTTTFFSYSEMTKRRKAARWTVLHSFQWKRLLVGWWEEIKRRNCRNLEKEVELWRRTRANTNAQRANIITPPHRLKFLYRLCFVFARKDSATNPSILESKGSRSLFRTNVSTC